MVQDGVDPLETLDSVQTTYHQYEKCHEIINTRESIGNLQRWQSQAISERTLNSASLDTCVLPKHGMDLLAPEVCHPIKIIFLEREYRRSVITQQTAVKHAVKWQTSTLPVGNPCSTITTDLTPKVHSGGPSATS